MVPEGGEADVRVFVNNHPVEVYPGASVRHALLRYSDTVYQEAVAGKLVVTDRHGNRLGLSGPLEEGLRLTVQGPGGYRPGPAAPVPAAPAPPPPEMAAPAAESALAKGDGAAEGSPLPANPNGSWSPRRRRRGRRRGQRRRNRPRSSPAQES